MTPSPTNFARAALLARQVRRVAATHATAGSGGEGVSSGFTPRSRAGPIFDLSTPQPRKAMTE